MLIETAMWCVGVQILLLAGLELVRRGVWALLRVEWEQAKRLEQDHREPLHRDMSSIEQDALL